MTGSRITTAPMALAAALALFACALALASGSVATAAAGLEATDCRNANASPSEASVRQLRKALLCLANERRKKAERGAVKANGDLKRVAQRHTKVMVQKDCLRHRCEGEDPLEERVLDSGYLDAGGRYSFGENVGCATTPAAMMRLWMKRKKTRRVIVKRKFEDAGMGVKKGAPDKPGCTGGDFGTFTLLLAWRQKSN